MKTRYSCDVIKLSLSSRLFVQRVPYRIWINSLFLGDKIFQIRLKINVPPTSMKSVLLFKERRSSSYIMSTNFYVDNGVN